MDDYGWVLALDHRTQDQLCGDPATPREVLHAFILNMEGRGRLMQGLALLIVKHPNVGAETLRVVLSHPDSNTHVLFYAAARPELPQEFLEELARADFGRANRARWAWEGLLNNPNIPKDVWKEVRDKREEQYVAPRLRGILG